MRVIALFIAGTLLFSGCGKDEPKEPKHSAEPTITAPTMPSAAQDNTVDGAVAFVKHYVEVFNYASNTGDVKELQRLSDPKCEGCNKYIELYKGTYEAGGYFKDSDWVLSSPTVEVRAGAYVVYGHISATPGRYRVESGSNERSGRAENFDATYLPFRSSLGWQMTTFGKRDGSEK